MACWVSDMGVGVRGSGREEKCGERWVANEKIRKREQYNVRKNL